MSVLVVVSRFRVDADDLGGAEELAGGLQVALAALAARPGYVDGHVARNLDDPGLWLLTTTWENVGGYRRALSTYDVKVNAGPLLSRAVDEPSAFETVAPGDLGNEQRPRDLD